MEARFADDRVVLPVHHRSKCAIVVGKSRLVDNVSRKIDRAVQPNLSADRGKRLSTATEAATGDQLSVPYIIRRRATLS